MDGFLFRRSSCSPTRDFLVARLNGVERNRKKLRTITGASMLDHVSLGVTDLQRSRQQFVDVNVRKRPSNEQILAELKKIR